jgi:hypothetical protein
MDHGDEDVCALRCCNRKFSRMYQMYGVLQQLCDYHQTIDVAMHHFDERTNAWECLRSATHEKIAECHICRRSFKYYSPSRIKKYPGSNACPRKDCPNRGPFNENYHSAPYDASVSISVNEANDPRTYTSIPDDKSEGSFETFVYKEERLANEVRPQVTQSYKEHLKSVGLERKINYTHQYKTPLIAFPEYCRKGIRVREDGFFKPHSSLGFDRVVAESSNLKKAYGYDMGLVMVDVGGSPHRNYIHKQLFDEVVYLCPTLDSSDVVRSLSRRKSEGLVDCTLGEFKTNAPHFLNLTQSLYYIGLEGLFDYMVENTNCHFAVASVHGFFEKGEGELMNEAKVVVNDNYVNMHVYNTNKTYSHPALQELAKMNGKKFERDGLVYTLTWDLHDHTRLTNCYVFRLVLGEFPISKVGRMVEKVSESITFSSYHGLGLFAITYNNFHFSVIPEVEKEVSVKAQFLNRSAANLATVVRAIIRENKNLLDTYSSREIEANIAYFFYKNVGFENDLMRTLNHRHSLGVFDNNRLLADRMFFGIDIKYWIEYCCHPLVYQTSGLVKLVGFVSLMSSESFLTGFLRSCAWFVVVCYKMLRMAVRYCVDSVEDLVDHKPAKKEFGVFSNEDFERDSYFFVLTYLLISLLFVFIYTVVLVEDPVVYYKKIIGGMKVMWKRKDYTEIPENKVPTMSSESWMKEAKTDHIEKVDPGFKQEKPKPLYSLMGHINGFTPNNTDGTTEMTERAIDLRWVDPKPHENLDVNMWKNLHCWYLEKLNNYVCSEPLMEITEEMFTEWIRRFKGLKLSMLKKGVEHLGIVNANGIDFAGWKAFIKREKLYKTLDGEIKPRGIVHGNPAYNAFFGPWFYHMYRRVKNTFRYMDMPVTICSGINRSQLSCVVDRAFKSGKKYIYENDFTQYEKTQTLGCYITESIFYKRNGMPCWLVDNYVKLHEKTKAKTSKYTSFNIDYARFSGDQTTSQGNSLTTASVICYILMEIFGLETSQFEILVLGDDLLLLCEVPLDEKRFSELLSSFGFKSKLFHRTIRTVNFLSMNFLLGVDGVYRAYPKIGKFILSRSHATSSMARDNPLAVLKSNFLSEEKYLKGHPILGPFCNAVLMGLKGKKIPKMVMLEVEEQNKYKFIQEGDRGYDALIDERDFYEYMEENYGMFKEDITDIMMDLRFLGYKRDGLDNPRLTAIFEAEGL